MKLSDRARAQIDTCVHCGLCLPACPTYRELGNEADSPRGRIHLIRSLALGELQPTGPVLRHLDLCLDCRACESACPSGVKYGAIIEETRSQLARTRTRSFTSRVLRRFFFRTILPKPGRLRGLARGLRLAQRLQLDCLAAHAGLLPGPLAAMAEVACIPDVFGRERLPAVVPARGARRWRVGLLTGCVMDVMFGPTNLASVRVLAANGCEVVIPAGQTCCGALPEHAGDREGARNLARQTIDVFLAAGVDFIIVNAAGCGSTMKEYHHLLHDDPAYREKAERFAAITRDITEFLGAIDLVEPAHAVKAKVAYQDACHLAHGQGVRLQPRSLLQQIPGLTLVPMAEADGCCGSAGIYNLVEPEMATALLDRKMEAAARTGAQIIASANPGCILQLRLGAHRRGLPVQVLHVIDLLDRAYGEGM